MVWLGPTTDPLDRERALCDAWFAEGLTSEDRAWIREQWALVDVQPPRVDIRWLQMQSIR